MKESMVMFHELKNEPVPEKYKDNMKTHAELLEELKQDLIDSVDHEDFHDLARPLLDKIEQFEAQLSVNKGDADEW